MANVKIRHYRVKAQRAYWEPSATAKALGFQAVALGRDGPSAWAEAERLNDLLDRRRVTQTDTGIYVPAYPPGSLGAIFQTYRQSEVWANKASRTREEWEDCWRVIEPVFGDIAAAAISAIPDCDNFYATLRQCYSHHKAHKIFKIFRALLNVAVATKAITTNPSMIVANKAPVGRHQTWREVDVEALANRAWEMRFFGLSVAIRVAYDTQFSPVDVRQLRFEQYKDDGRGGFFDIKRAKTRKRAIGTITSQTAEKIKLYRTKLGLIIPDDQPFIRDRFGKLYTKDALGDDFRTVRNAFYPGDDRTLLDMRRTGTVEAAAGGATPSDLSAKSGNTIGQSSKLHETYNPVQLVAVRRADEARMRGRKRLNENGGRTKVGK